MNHRSKINLITALRRTAVDKIEEYEIEKYDRDQMMSVLRQIAKKNKTHTKIIVVSK